MGLRKVLITGGTGQIGQELRRRAWPAEVEILAPRRTELDLSRKDSVFDAVGAEEWSCVINCAAYTAVDAAEDDAEAAFQANCQGPAWLAEATGAAGIPLIQLSTDYVFSGASDDRYAEEDEPSPLGVYGASKLAGEQEVLRANVRSTIIRTAWVVSPFGSNFLKTMLRLASERPQLRVVSDQFGCPSSAGDIADAVMTVALRQIDDPAAPTGIYHFVNAGEASWYALAVEIMRVSAVLGGPAAEVLPISTADYPTRARRPVNSRLATAKIERNYGVVPRDWRVAIAEIVGELIGSSAQKDRRE